MKVPYKYLSIYTDAYVNLLRNLSYLTLSVIAVAKEQLHYKNAPIWHIIRYIYSSIYMLDTGTTTGQIHQKKQHSCETA